MRGREKNLLDVIESGCLHRYADESEAGFTAKIMALKKQTARVIGVRHTVAFNSGTAALFCAMAALCVSPGDEVLVPGYTFVASISAIVYSRTVPVLCEIE